MFAPSSVLLPAAQAVLVQLVPSTPAAAQVDVAVSVPNCVVEPCEHTVLVHEVPNTPPAEQLSIWEIRPVAEALPAVQVLLM